MCGWGVERRGTVCGGEDGIVRRGRGDGGMHVGLRCDLYSSVKSGTMVSMAVYMVV